MSERKVSTSLWWALGAVVLGGLAFARRTRRYDLIHPDLRSPMWWFRTPAFGRGMVLASRLAGNRPAECVPGVALETRQIAAADCTKLTLFVYRPDTAKPSGPGMLYTHGGGMIVGSAAGYHETVSRYAEELGIVVVSAEYRLAPEHPYPTPLDDIYSAYQWMIAEADDLGVDRRRIAVGGESAGGGLTAALCQRVQDAGNVAPVFQLLIYPMLDDRTALHPAPAHRGQLNWTEGSNLYGWTAYLGHEPRVASAPGYAAPARRADLSGLPPAWIGVGTLDLFYDEDVQYARRLEDAGVPCELVEVEGAFHGFDLFSSKPVATSFHTRVLLAVRKALSLAGGNDVPA